MTIQTTTWSVPTCGCIVEYSWDDTLANPPYTLIRFINKDIIHSLFDDATAFSMITDEDARVSKVLRGVIDQFPTILSRTGVVGGGLPDGITYNFTVTGTAPNRVLNVSFSGITLTTNQKNTAQTWCDTHIGVGKVVVL